VRHQSQHWLFAEKILHGAIPQWLAVVVHVKALLVVGERGDELH